MEIETKTHREKPPLLRFYVKNGGLIFTTTACLFLNIQNGDRVHFFQDENNPKKWYFSISKDKGLIMRLHTYEYTFRFASKKLVNDLIKAFGSKINKLYISKCEINGKICYRLRK